MRSARRCSPPGRPPGYALNSALVWHVEAAAVVFGALYGAIVTLRLAFHGQTYTRVGRDGIDIPQVRPVESAAAGRTEESVSQLALGHDALWTAVARLRSDLELLHRTDV